MAELSIITAVRTSNSRDYERPTIFMLSLLIGISGAFADYVI
jgi:hypothetical protein